MFVQNLVKLSAAVREFSCWQRNKEKLGDDAENNTVVATTRMYDIVYLRVQIWCVS